MKSIVLSVQMGGHEHIAALLGAKHGPIFDPFLLHCRSIAAL